MAYRLGAFSNVGLTEALLQLIIDEHAASRVPRLRRLWTYFRNPAEPAAVGRSAVYARQNGRAYRLAQEAGLPARLSVGVGDAAADDRAQARREIVIENDIAWRVQAMVDFMFGKPVQIVSTARDERTRAVVQRVLDRVWEASGGIALLQDAALLGHVYGYVDLLLRRRDEDQADAPAAAELAAADVPDDQIEDVAQDAAQRLRVEVIEPLRGMPITSPADYRALDAYVIHFERELNAAEESTGDGVADAVARALGMGPVSAAARRKRGSVTEIFSRHWWQRYEDGKLAAEGPHALLEVDAARPGAGESCGCGELPVVHIQNIAQPFRYEGMSEVEPLIPLQDELNTRLSDRASRVTMQSFKMYLVKGLEGGGQVPVGPGQVWSTDNPLASVEAFGGDGASPSEETHIREVREAMDKASGVPPLASGVVQAKIGSLSSANALRITLMSVLSKTARKRVTYGRGIAQMCRHILAALDAAGVIKTSEADRGVTLRWSDPLPEDLGEQVAAARVKADLGVPREQVLGELGYPSASDAALGVQ